MATAREILRSAPDRFRPEKAGEFTGRVNFELSGDGGGEFQMHIAEGQCRLSEGLSKNPDCTIKAKARHYADLELGKLNPQMALFTGKIKVSNLNLMMQFVKLFHRYREEEKAGASAAVADRKPNEGLLTGIRILDLSRLLPGPLATMMLAEMGAEVIKIEDPDKPDYVREAMPAVGDTAAFYLALNRSKRSLTLPLAKEEGKEAFRRLLKTADLVVEQFRPGVLDAMGLGFSEAQKINPRVTYVSLTGYGQYGPRSQVAGHDLNYLAWSGILSLTKDDRGKPVIPGVQIADIAAGSYLCANACLAALVANRNGQSGKHLDVSMSDGLLPLLSLNMADLWATKKTTDNQQAMLSGGLPNYNVYPTSDGKWMALGALEPKFWTAFCQGVEHPEWIEALVPEKATALDLKGQLSALFQSRTRQEWTELGKKADCCLAPVLEIDELEADDHHQARSAFASVGNFKGIRNPLQIDGKPAEISWEAPRLGADSRAILKDLGYDPEAISRLLDQ